MASKKIAITLPEELFDMLEQARAIEHRSRSVVIQEALRRHFGAPVYTPSDDERRLLDEALAGLEQVPEASRPWSTVRGEIWPEQ